MNRKLKWFLTFLTSGILVAISLVPLRMAHQIVWINRYIRVPETLMKYANLCLMQGILNIIIAILLILLVWWKEE